MEAPTTIGPYRVVEKLGTGGMGVVFKCLDEPLRRHVAVKVLREKYAQDANYRRRFQREAQVVASISHPSVAHVYGIGEFQGRVSSTVYIAMEFVDGTSLDQVLAREGKLPLKKAVALAREVALGLKEAYSKGIIHRDIKPSNLLVTAAGGVKIVDFGLAKELGGKNSMTDVGIVLGTPHYISPEQGRGQVVDHRSDVYSLGCTLYHLLTGKPPFEGGSQVSVIVSHVNDSPLPPHLVEGRVPEAASCVVLKMLSKSPESRYQDYGELIDDLDALLADRAPAHVGATAHADARAGATAEGPAASTALLEVPGRVREAAPPGRRRRRTGLWAAAGLLVLLALTASALLFFLLRSSSENPVLAGLGSWYQRTSDGRDFLNLQFAQPERSALEALHRLVIFEPGAARSGTPPHLAGGALCWESFVAPLACSLEYSRVDEIRVILGPTSGSFDLGLALVDRWGAERRLLSLRLRPLEITLRPLLARRSSEEIPLARTREEEGKGAAPRSKAGTPTTGPQPSSASGDPLPPVPRLGQGPFEVALEFETTQAQTLVKIRISKKYAARPLYQTSAALEGTDWASGVLVVQTPSPVTPFSVAVDRISILGRLAESPGIEEVPWRS